MATFTIKLGNPRNPFGNYKRWLKARKWKSIRRAQQLREKRFHIISNCNGGK